MANTQQNQTQNAKIQGLLAHYLQLRSAGSGRVDRPGHLDEDTLNAFTDGGLSEREATPVLYHLTDCSFCRHRTVELVRLEMYFSEQDEPVSVLQVADAPVSVSSVLSGILNRIFGSSEGAVFAHEEREETDDPKAETDSDDKRD